LINYNIPKKEEEDSMPEPQKSNEIDPFDLAFKLVGINDLSKIEKTFLIKMLVSLWQVKQRFGNARDVKEMIKALSITVFFAEKARDFLAEVFEYETDEEVREGAKDALAKIDNPIEDTD